MTTSVRVCILGMLLAAFEASAQRISLPDFSGRGASAARTQLVNQLCDTAECVAPTKVIVGGKPDMKKAKRESLEYFVTGAATKGKRGKPSTLLITVVPVKGGPKAKRAFPLDKSGSLSSRNLQAAVDLIRGVIGTGESAPPAREPEPEPAPEPEPEPAPRPLEPTGPREPTEPVEPSVERRAELPPPPPKRASGVKPSFLVIDLGMDVLNRRLSYGEGTNDTANVRQYDLTLFPMPVVRLELYPIALSRSDALAGFGLEAAFGIAPYLKSRRQSTEESFPTSAMKLDVGARWRFVVSPTFPLAVAPFLGLKVQSFAVGRVQTATGEVLALDGLPNIAFVGLRLGVGLEVPLVPNLLLITGRVAILPIFSSGQIISADYFQQGSAFGFEAGAGVAVQLAKMLQIRASFEFTQYGLTFKPTEEDVYRKPSATDRYLGGNLSLRLQF